jgi:hypothetical protein
MGKHLLYRQWLPIVLVAFLCGIGCPVSAEETEAVSGVEATASSASGSEAAAAYQKELMDKFNSLVEGKELHPRDSCKSHQERCNSLLKALMDGNFTFVPALSVDDPMKARLDNTCAHAKSWPVLDAPDQGERFVPQGPLTWYRVPFSEPRQYFGKDIYILRAEDYTEVLQPKPIWTIDGQFYIFSLKHCRTVVPDVRFYKYFSGTQTWHDLPVKTKWMAEPILIGSGLYFLSVFTAQDQGEPQTLDVWLHPSLGAAPFDFFAFTTEGE